MFSFSMKKGEVLALAGESGCEGHIGKGDTGIKKGRFRDGGGGDAPQ